MDIRCRENQTPMADAPNSQSTKTSRDGVVHSWDLLIAFFGGNAAGAMLGIVLAVVVLVAAIGQGFRPTPAAVSTALQTNYWLFQILLGAGEVGFIGGVLLVAHWRFEHPLAHYFAPTRAFAVALALLSGVGLSVLINVGNGLLQSAHAIDLPDTNMDKLMQPHSALQSLPAFLSIALLAPFAEELFFRGLFFSWLLRRAGAWTATLVTAAIFAILHGQPLMHPGLGGWLLTFELFLAGIVLAQWMVRTGSLRTSFATHFAFNATALALPVFLS
jgi:membrane protease YdiL (CAAX protease family)